MKGKVGLGKKDDDEGEEDGGWERLLIGSGRMLGTKVSGGEEGIREYIRVRNGRESWSKECVSQCHSH